MNKIGTLLQLKYPSIRFMNRAQTLKFKESNDVVEFNRIRTSKFEQLVGVTTYRLDVNRLEFWVDDKNGRAGPMQLYVSNRGFAWISSADVAFEIAAELEDQIFDELSGLGFVGLNRDSFD